MAVRRSSFEIFRWHGDPKRVARESWFIGTVLSAPVVMMAVHVAATAVLVRRRSRRAPGTLGTLGATMVAGSLIENKLRSAMRRPLKDPVVTAVGGTGFILAVAMAFLGVREARSARFRATQRVESRTGSSPQVVSGRSTAPCVVTSPSPSRRRTPHIGGSRLSGAGVFTRRAVARSAGPADRPAPPRPACGRVARRTGRAWRTPTRRTSRSTTRTGAGPRPPPRWCDLAP